MALLPMQVSARGPEPLFGLQTVGAPLGWASDLPQKGARVLAGWMKASRQARQEGDLVFYQDGVPAGGRAVSLPV